MESLTLCLLSPEGKQQYRIASGQVPANVQRIKHLVHLLFVPATPGFWRAPLANFSSFLGISLMANKVLVTIHTPQTHKKLYLWESLLTSHFSCINSLIRTIVAG